MNIVKQSTGNVVLTDAGGNIIKVFVLVNALDVVSSNEVVIKFGFNQWHSLFANSINNTQVEPASPVPFSGNAYDLVALLSSSFFFELSGGGVSQNLSQVLTVGNSAGANDIDLNNNDLLNVGLINGVSFPYVSNLSSVLSAGNSANNQDINDVDKIDFNLATTDVAGIGQLKWNNTDGTLDLGLKGGNVTLQIGQEQVARVVNKTSPLIDLLEANYQVVKIVGATGQRLSVALAQGNNDLNSADTIGVVTENINKNQEGFICTSGQVREINTTGSLQGESWNDGDILYLSPTIAGRLTNIKPIAPQHSVIVGFVEYAHNNHGKIYVKVDNGYELNELHNVAFPTAVANNEILKYNTSNVRWENAKFPIEIQAACSDESTAITAGTNKVTFRLPVAFTLTSVRASLTTAQASGSIFTVDINLGGASILSTKLTIDNTEKTSVTAVTAPVISNPTMTDDGEITVDVDQIGNSTATGLKITLIGYR